MSRKKEKNEEPVVHVWARTCYGLVKDYFEKKNRKGKEKDGKEN